MAQKVRWFQSAQRLDDSHKHPLQLPVKPPGEKARGINLLDGKSPIDRTGGQMNLRQRCSHDHGCCTSRTMVFRGFFEMPESRRISLRSMKSSSQRDGDLSTEKMRMAFKKLITVQNTPLSNGFTLIVISSMASAPWDDVLWRHHGMNKWGCRSICLVLR
jgi:hypothetical protein